MALLAGGMAVVRWIMTIRQRMEASRGRIGTTVKRDETARRRGRLRLLSITVPLVGLAALYPLRLVLLRVWPSLAADVAIGLLMTAGVLTFSWAVFRVIDRQDRSLARQHDELERRYANEHRLRAQLEALHEAALAIASAQTTADILQRLVDLARDLIGARYAALGVLGPQGAIDGFYTAGISDELRAQLGPPPQGHGLLGVVLTEGTALRITDIAADPRSLGFPPGHPPMRSLLAVPLAHHGHVVGNLYLADKGAETAFSPEDERLLTLLAGHAAVVIQNARLAEQVRTLAVGAERHRISKDLHDGVIQAIYATSLELESAADDLEADPTAARDRIDTAIDRLGDVTKDMRRYILGLQSEQATDQSLTEALAALLAEARVHTLVEPHLRVEGEKVDDLPPALAQELLHVTREAVANVMRHARASRLWVTLQATESEVHLRIVDDGVGFDPASAPPAGHYGLRNLRERAAGLDGALTVRSDPGQGTAIDLRAPVAAPEGVDIHV